MTTWAAQMAEHFGEQIAPHIAYYGACSCGMCTERIYQHARLAGHFGRIALGQTEVIDSHRWEDKGN